MSTMAGLKKKIEYAGLSEEVTDMIFERKMTGKEICAELKTKHGVDVSEGTISNFKKFIIDTVPEFLEQNEEYRKKLAERYLDTVENLIYGLEKIKKKIDTFEDPKQWRQQTQYLNLFLSELHMLLKRAGEIKPSQFIEKQEITNIQINQMVQMELVRLIDDKKIPLDACAPEIQEFYKKAKAMR